MGTRYTTTSIISGYNPESIIVNFNDIEDALEDTISRTGQGANQMEADFDLNSNDLTNVSNVYADRLVLGGTEVSSFVTFPEYQGLWLTSTSYPKNTLVKESNNVYIALEEHTSGVFADDLAALKWDLMVPQSLPGAGTGDLLATNNLDDVDDTAVARTNLGLAIGSNVQGYNSQTVFADTSTVFTEDMSFDSRILFYNPGSDYRYGLIGYSGGGGALTHTDDSNTQVGNVLVWTQSSSSGVDDLDVFTGGSRSHTFFPYDGGAAVLDDRGVLTQGNLKASSAGYLGEEVVEDLYDFSVDGIVTDATSLDFEDGYEYSMEFFQMSHNFAGTTQLRLSPTYEDDSLDTHMYITEIVVGERLTGVLDLKGFREAAPRKWVTGTLQQGVYTPSGPIANTDTIPVAGGFLSAGSKKIKNIRVHLLSGSIDGGYIRITKRPKVT